MDQRQTLETLATQIEDNRVKAVGGRSFVPPSSLSAIFTPHAIAVAVSELSCADEDRLGLAHDIQHGGVRTFAILVSMRQSSLVVNFRRHRCLDRLPLDDATVQRAAGGYASRFLREQWDFQPYHFRRGHDVEIMGSEILPFIRNLGPLNAGAFGDTDKLEIHPLLQDFVSYETRQVVVVRKTLRKDSMVSEERRVALFNNEKRCLRLINHSPHPNIVPLLSSYVHDHSYCMLFPLLDMDLKAFLERPSPYGNFCRTLTYFSALHGLASALGRTHHVSIRLEAEGINVDSIGYHHDLRPANVLVGRDTFLLADFGMGNVKPRDDGSATRFKALSSDYVAPECMDEQFEHLTAGRAMDVWAFGCLAVEVMTYAYLGLAGLTTFRTARKVPRPSEIVTDSFFHDVQGKIKAEVSEWIDSLAAEECRRTLGMPLRDLFRSILRPVDERPQISEVCLRFADLSLKAHFFAVSDALADIFDDQENIPNPGPLMKLWFEHERLRAFGNVLCLGSPATNPGVPKFVEEHGEKCVKILLELIHKLPQVEESTAEYATDNSPKPSELQPAHIPPTSASSSSHTLRMGEITLRGNVRVDIAADQPAGDATDAQKSLEEDVQGLIQELWDLLSEAESRKAERVWFHSMLDTDSINRLGQIERVLQIQRPATYQHGAALAMMKKIRLEMLSDPGREGNSGELEIPDDAIPQTDRQATHGHYMGVYNDCYPVLIETMFYDQSWEKIPLQEQALVMAHKAKGFNVNPRPPSLCLLDCIGFFEKGKKGGRKGFSFVYRIPKPVRDLDLGAPPDKRGIMTLQSLLILTVNQPVADRHKSLPLLGDKIWLASKLASFLYEFHCIGWLHENLHSNNIIYFDTPSKMCEKGISAATSSILCDPFVVGLNKSRPGGEAWHTQGPADDKDFLDYRHPAYDQTRPFRVGYDYYSLGIVLLEIGLWRPLASIAQKKKYSVLRPAELRNKLIERYVPQLGHSMGRTYRDVVMLLLSDGLDPDPLRKTPEPAIDKQAFGTFTEKVVEPLERLAGGNV